MPQFTWAIMQLLRRLMITPLLIVVWHFLYPWILHVLANSAYAQDLSRRLDNRLLEIALLLFLTFWFYRYADGFFNECDLLGLAFVQMAVCATRWVVVGIWHLIAPPFIGVLMWYGLNHYTEVPSWLTATTSILLFLGLLQRGWTYPQDKVLAISYQTRFE
jgi:hypothetical protein